MTVAFLDPGDPRWTEALDAADHDVYHRPEYACASANHEGGRPVAFYASTGDAFFLVPLLVRDLPPEAASSSDDAVRDATTPYGYPSPLCTAADASPFWAAFVDALRRRGIVSVFLRMHPLLPVPVDALPTPSAVVEHGPTVVVDCTRSPDEMWSDTRPDHRSDVNRLRRRGYRVVIDAPDARDAPLDAFVRLYEQTMERVGADAFYFFPESYYRAWTASLASHGRLAVVRSASGKAAAAGLFTDCNGRMQYHLSGTDAAHRDVAPSKLMLHEVRRWAHRHGRTALHLGGGLGGTADSLFDFKAGFSSGRATFRSVRIVTDPARYRAACRAAGVEAPPSPQDGYFPAYRSR
jgi:hypothetical protein